MIRTLLAALLLCGSAPRGGITTPVEVPLPEGVDASRAWKLLDERGREVPAQIVKGDKPSLAWIHDHDIGSEPRKAPYRLEAGEPKAFPKVEVADVGGKHLVFSYDGKKILQYNYGGVQPPAGVDAVFARSGYIHPIWTPEGRVISNDFPAKHLHHHGIWFPWTSSEFEGRKSDFWNSKEKQGKIECVKVEETFSGPVFGGFRVRHRFLNLNGPDGPKAALDEVWDVRVYAMMEGRFVFDLVSTQTCATDKPLVIKKYYYGGLGFRGSGEWEGKDGVQYTTSEGKTRANGNETTGKWCYMTGKVEGKPASIAFLGHPSNFRFPQGMRLHPNEPFFNFCPAQGGDFSIEPGKPYVSRFRFVVADGEHMPVVVDGFWNEYTAPHVTLNVTK